MSLRWEEFSAFRSHLFCFFKTCFFFFLPVWSPPSGKCVNLPKCQPQLAAPQFVVAVVARRRSSCREGRWEKQKCQCVRAPASEKDLFLLAAGKPQTGCSNRKPQTLQKLCVKVSGSISPAQLHSSLLFGQAAANKFNWPPVVKREKTNIVRIFLKVRKLLFISGQQQTKTN